MSEQGRPGQSSGPTPPPTAAQPHPMQQQQQQQHHLPRKGPHHPQLHPHAPHNPFAQQHSTFPHAHQPMMAPIVPYFMPLSYQQFPMSAPPAAYMAPPLQFQQQQRMSTTGVKGPPGGGGGGVAVKGPSPKQQSLPGRPKKRGRPKGSCAVSDSTTSRAKTLFGKRRNGSSVRLLQIVDMDPARITNCLIELPPRDSTVHSQDLEMTHLAISHHAPDTYPLAYYARILGFDVPLLQPTTTRAVAMDPMTVPLHTRSIECYHQVPPLSTWYRQVSNVSSLDTLNQVDPFYTRLCQLDGSNAALESLLTPANNLPAPSQTLLDEVLQTLGKPDDSTSISVTRQADTGVFTLALNDNQAVCTYEFAWMDATDASSSANKVSELILHVKQINVTNSKNNNNNNSQDLIAAICTVLQHARSCNVWYGLWRGSLAIDDNLNLFKQYFGMVPIHFCKEQSNANTTDYKETSTTTLICDLHQSSTKHVSLLLKKLPDSNDGTTFATRQRMLVRLPTLEDLQGKTTSARNAKRQDTNFITSAKEVTRPVAFGVRVQSAPREEGESAPMIQILNGNGDLQEGPSSSPIVPTVPPQQPLSWDVIKIFDMVIPNTQENKVDDDDEILRELKQKQSKLVALQPAMEMKARSLLQKVVDVRMDYEVQREKREKDAEMLNSYRSALERRKEMDDAWQKQLEQDMDAVCEICRDGEVTPDNQILFCESCNVAVHQMCYGIEEVPEGDYYCIACRFLNREKISEAMSRRGVQRLGPSPLPICCELCPLKQGAFVRSGASTHTNPDGSSGSSKWVHVVCAKWQGLNFEPMGQTEVVEDVKDLKIQFLRAGYKCMLCQGRRGAYVNCREPGCNNWLHTTCARVSGLCEVVHGENCHGGLDDNPWSLLCPDHSGDIEQKSAREPMSIEQLVQAAAEFPPEPFVPVTVKPDKPFNKMSGKERRKFLADREYEEKLLIELAGKLHGVYCEVCNQCENEGKNLIRCVDCSCVFCTSCMLECDLTCDPKNYRCPACTFKKEKTKSGEAFEEPQCHMCFQKGGWLRKGFAQPVNKKSFFRNNPAEFAKTLFAKEVLWCHSLCTMWHPEVTASPEDGTVNCVNIIMSNGLGHIRDRTKCELCGETARMKLSCSEEGCRAWGEKKRPVSFHITCARQAGFEVRDRKSYHDVYGYFDAKCFRHSDCAFVFRARLEDLIEVERLRAGERFERVDNFMSFAHASRLLNKAIDVMHMLGWAWRWAEWWVANGDNWEPLIEPGQNEKKMTKEQLKIVDHTRESRCAAARKCRLAALGAALRNRDYKDQGDDTVALDRALRALLHTPELVGPLLPYEIEFFAEWLGRAYRSQSSVLGFGKDKIPVKDAIGTVHIEDKSPKYVLGSRRLPGKQEMPEGAVFATNFTDIDDFDKPETFPDGSLVTADALVSAKRPGRKPKQGKKIEKSGKRANTSIYETSPPSAAAGNYDEGRQIELVTNAAPPPKRMGRPPKKAAVASASAPPNVAAPPQKRIGRPPKNKPQPEDIATPIVDPAQPEANASANTPTGSAEPRKKKKKMGWPKGKPRRQSPDGIILSTPMKGVPGRPQLETSSELNELEGPEMRRGAPTGPVDTSVSPPKKRRGRPPRNKTLGEYTVGVGADSSKQEGRNENVFEIDGGVGIAERLKRRRGSTEAQSESMAAPSPKCRSVRRNSSDGKQEDILVSARPLPASKKLVLGSKRAEAQNVEAAPSSDDDMPLSSYVQKHKRGATPSFGKQLPTSSSSESSKEPEYEPEELSPAQRGRRRGKEVAEKQMPGS